MEGGHRTVVAGVHGLEHVERLSTTTLTYDDPLRAHTQRVDDQSLDRDLAFAVDVLRPRLQAAHAPPPQLNPRPPLDPHHPPLPRHQPAHNPAAPGLPRAGPPPPPHAALRQPPR